MKSKFFVIVAAVSIIFSGCAKEPKAYFTTDKNEYVAGDIVKLTNTSVDGKTFLWTFPDGTTSDLASVDYITKEDLKDGTLTFKLQAFSKKEKKTDDVSKTVTVKAATGQLLVWTALNNFGTIAVSIDNVSAGNITQRYGTAPECGAVGSVTSTLKVGTHTITASNSSYTWSGTITVAKNQCSKFELQ